MGFVVQATLLDLSIFTARRYT